MIFLRGGNFRALRLSGGWIGGGGWRRGGDGPIGVSPMAVRGPTGPLGAAALIRDSALIEKFRLTIQTTNQTFAYILRLYSF